MCDMIRGAESSPEIQGHMANEDKGMSKTTWEGRK